MKKNVEFKVLKQRNRQNVAHFKHNNKYPTIDGKVASIVDSKQYEDFFKTPREVFGRTLSPAERNYWIVKILPYQMKQLGFKGFIVNYYKDDSFTYANHLTNILQPIYNKKQDTPNASLTNQELELCRKIQKAYTGVLQLSGGEASQKDEFKKSFQILDDWMHNHKVSTKKSVEVHKTYDMNYDANILSKSRYKAKVENDGFLVNTHKTMAEKKKHQTNILLSANNKKQDNKFLTNKRKEPNQNNENDVHLKTPAPVDPNRETLKNDNVINNLFDQKNNDNIINDPFNNNLFDNNSFNPFDNPFSNNPFVINNNDNNLNGGGLDSFNSIDSEQGIINKNSILFNLGNNEKFNGIGEI